MSPEAIDQRLVDLAALWKLGQELQEARRLGKVEDLRRHPGQTAPSKR
jgi:hypothetical protein